MQSPRRPESPYSSARRHPRSPTSAATARQHQERGGSLVREHARRFIQTVKQQTPLPYPSPKAEASASEDALLTFSARAIRGLPLPDQAWDVVALGNDHSSAETATETESVLSGMAASDQDAYMASRHYDPLDEYFSVGQADGEDRTANDARPQVPEWCRELMRTGSGTGLAVLGVTWSWFDGLGGRPFGESHNLPLALIADPKLHDVVQLTMKADGKLPVLVHQSPPMSFDIPEHLLYSLMSPNMRSNYLVAEMHITGHKRIVSLGWSPISLQGLTSKTVERNTPIYRGTPRVLLALEPPFDLPHPSMTPISGAALSFRLSSEANGISDLVQFFHANTFLYDINPVYPVLNQVTFESIHVSFCGTGGGGNSKEKLESQIIDTIASLYHHSLPSGDASSNENLIIQEKRLCIGLHNHHKFVGKITRVFSASESPEDGSLAFADIFLSDVFVDPTLTLLVWMEYQIKHTWIVAGWGMVPTTDLPQYSDTFRIDLQSTSFLPDRLSFVHESTFLSIDAVIEVYDLPPSPSKPKPPPAVPLAPTVEPQPTAPPPAHAGQVQTSHHSLVDPGRKDTDERMPEQLEDADMDPAPSKPVQPDPSLNSGILYPQPEPKSLLGLSRAHLARLLAARFPLATALCPTERPGNASLDAEARDTRTVNCISLLFLAFASACTSRVPVPEHVRIDFTFYTFAPVSTSTLLLTGSDPADRQAPTVLSHLDAPFDGHLEQYTVDLADEMPAPGLLASLPPSSFTHYLSTSSLTVHVWDASTCHLVGRGQVPLSCLLRHGRDRSTEVHAVPIGDPHVGSNAVLGTLYLTMENVGQVPQQSAGNADGGVRLTWADIVNTRYATNRAGDFRQHLARRTKVPCMVAKLTQTVDVDPPLALGERRQRYKCLVDEIQASRERRKFSEISKRIRGEMTTHYQGHVMFGCSHFFQFSFSNPKPADSLYRIVVDEPNLRVLTHDPELRFFLSDSQPKPVVHLRNSQLELLVHPMESVSIPLLFTSVEVASEIRGSVSVLDVHTGNTVARLECTFFVHRAPVHNHLLFHASANEYFRCSIPLANVMSTAPAAFPVRPVAMGGLVTSETAHTAGSQALTVATANRSNTVASVRCFDSDVYCGIDASAATLQLKLRAPRDPPSTRDIFLYVYADMFAHQLVSVVRITIRATQRVDVVGHLGQSTTVALTVPPSVVRSAGHRIVSCYKSTSLLSSGGAEASAVKVTREGSMPLSTGSFEVKYSPTKVGDECQVVTLVDTATKELVWIWSLHCQSLAPLVTKTFQLALPLHRSISKRISFTNPYRLAKIFHVSTSHPNLVAIREDVFELSATGTIYLHLTFTNMDSPVHVDVYIYINDQEGNAEECFCIQADYKGDGHGSGAKNGQGGPGGASMASVHR